MQTPCSLDSSDTDTALSDHRRRETIGDEVGAEEHLGAIAIEIDWEVDRTSTRTITGGTAGSGARSSGSLLATRPGQHRRAEGDSLAVVERNLAVLETRAVQLEACDKSVLVLFKGCRHVVFRVSGRHSKRVIPSGVLCPSEHMTHPLEGSERMKPGYNKKTGMKLT